MLIIDELQAKIAALKAENEVLEIKVKNYRKGWDAATEEGLRLQAELETNKFLIEHGAKALIEKLQAELDAARKVIDEIYDTTIEGYVIEMIDVLRGDAVWGEKGEADYSKKGGK